RKDEELYTLLLSKGVKKENAVFLKDEDATLMNIRKNLDALLVKTTPGSSFVFYYAGHGVRAGDGPVYFANYDFMDAKGNGLQTGIMIKEYRLEKPGWNWKMPCATGKGN